MQKFWAFIAAMLLGAGLSAPACAEWHKAETDNFIIYSEGSENRIRAFAVELEQFDALLHFLHGFERKPNLNKPVIYLLRRQRDVSELAGNGVRGFYSNGLYETRLVGLHSRIDSDYDLSGREVLFHEYAHHFMYRNFNTAVPAWYSEAFAEFYSTVDIGEDEIKVGLAANHRTRGLFGGDGESVGTFLLAERGDYSSYSRGWLFLHMMQSDPDYRRLLSAYLNAFRSGQSASEAAEIFGDLDQLTAALDAYRKSELQVGIVASDGIGRPEIAITKPDALDQELIALWLLRGRYDQSDRLAALESLNGRFAGDVRLSYEIAISHISAAKAVDSQFERLEIQRRKLTGDALKDDERRDIEKSIKEMIEEYELSDEDAARARQAESYRLADEAADRALALVPDHPGANVVKGELLLHAAKVQKDDTLWRAARSHFVRANKAAPNDPVPMYFWHRAFVLSGDAMPEVAHLGLRKSFELAPENPQIRLALAQDLAGLGHYEAAIKLAEVEAYSPHASDSAKEALEEIRARAGLGGTDKRAGAKSAAVEPAA